MNILKYYKMNEDVKEPIFATDGSACFDICASIKDNEPITVYRMRNLKVQVNPINKTIRIAPGDRVLIPTGLIFDIPECHSVRLHIRSSVSLKKGLTMPNGEGIIDSDYYHQTFVMLHNASADEVLIENGERIAQGELIQTYDYAVTETENIPEQKTNRVGGFGSTGVK
tara:strand:+ start:185 stop:691 length:507 start_codon:yes stop_codon:yes gene_type:complete